MSQEISKESYGRLRHNRSVNRMALTIPV